jgi:hypothetical protein
MQGNLRHWDEDKEIRVTIYWVCVLAVAICIGLSVYILR